MLKTLSKREKIMLSVLVVVMLVFAFTQYILTPQLAAYEEMKANFKEQTQQLTQVKVLAKSGANQDDLILQSEKKLKQIEDQFNAEVSDGAGMVKLAIETIHEKVEFIGFQPLPVQDKTYYYEAPFRIVLRGDFANVLSYFKNLEQQKILPNPVEIRDLKITQPKLRDKEKQNDNHRGISPGMNDTEKAPNLAIGIVEASFVLMTYSNHDPQSLLALEEVSKLAVGRKNPFLYPGPISPYPGVNPILAPPDGSSPT